MMKLLKHLKPFTFMIIMILILMLSQSIAELYLPTLMSDIVSKGMVNGDNGYIWKTGEIMLLVAGASAVCSIIGGFLSSKAAVGFGRDVRNKVFTRVESYSLNEFDKIGTASLITRTTNDINQVQNVLIMILRMMISAPMMAIGGLILAYSKDQHLFNILLVAIPVLLVAIIITGLIVLPLFKAMQKKVDKVNLIVRENLIGIRVIRAFNRQQDERKRFVESNEDLTTLAIKVNKIMAGLMPIMMIIMNLTTVAVIWFGASRIDDLISTNASNLSDAGTKLGNMMAFLQYAMQIMFSFIMVAMMFVLIPRAQASAVRINEVLDIKGEINDPEKPKYPQEQKGHVEFRNVTFSYPGAEQPAISNISFDAKAGEITAIIGGTGSGKSTLISLIPRFYDIDNGSILVDGMDIREMTQEVLRAKIGFVPQKALLFSGTIAENIKYGKSNANNEEVNYAAKIAQAEDFISEMKDGFDSLIAQGGTNVSGGQKQRLSIARALIRKPEIYVFDDSFSALDFKTDAQLRGALKSETKDSTVIIVAQRVSTVMDADRIIVLDEGSIVGMGNHKELLNNCEVYKEIVLSQLSKEELA